MDEMFLAGELVESSKQVVLERMRLLDRNNKEQAAKGGGTKKKEEKVKKADDAKTR